MDLIIGKDYLQFGAEKLLPPFERTKVDAVLGKPSVEEWDTQMDRKTYHGVAYLWNSLGIRATSSDNADTYDGFEIYVKEGERLPHAAKGVFPGRVLIGGKEYSQCKMKRDFFTHELSYGCFKINTFLMEEINQVKEKFRNAAERTSRSVEIAYQPPKKKTAKYELRKQDAPILKFDHFNFKLLVVEQLMYKKELLTPKFDIYEFAQEYSGREIDVDEEGYDAPIREAADWFRQLEIPASLAGEVTELLWDGGLKVFGQIYPFWDGEDSVFDLTELSEDELLQFGSLKKVIAENLPEQVVQTLSAHGIEIAD